MSVLLAASFAAGTTAAAAEHPTITASRIFFSSLANMPAGAPSNYWAAELAGTPSRRLASEDWYDAKRCVTIRNLIVESVDFPSADTAKLDLTFEQLRVRPDGTLQPRVFRRLVDWQRRDGQWLIMRYTTAERERVAPINDVAGVEALRKQLSDRRDLASVELSRALTVKAWMLTNQLRSDFANALAQLAFDIAKSQDDPGAMANALYVISAVNRVRDLDAALRDADEELRLANLSGDPDEILLAYSSQGRALVQRGQVVEAGEAFHKAIALKDDIADGAMLVPIFNLLGQVAFLRDDYLQSVQYLKQTARLAELWGRFDEVVHAETNMAELFVYQGMPDLGLAVFQRVQPKLEKMNDRMGAIINIASMGEAYKRLGRFDEAVAAFQKTLKISRDTRETQLMIESLNALGQLEMKRGRLLKAAEYLHESVDTARQLNSLQYLVPGLLLLTELQIQERKLADALATAEETVALARKSNLSFEMIDSLTLRGRVLRAQGHPREARQSFQGAIEQVELLRERFIGTETAKQRGFEALTEPYVNLVDLLVAEDHPDEALQIAERAKSRVLMEVLAGGRAERSRFLTTSEGQAEEAMQAAIAQLNRAIQESNDEAKLTTLRESLRQKRFEYQQLELENDARHPDLKVRRGSITPISTAEPNRLLPSGRDAALVEFVITPERTHIFVVSRRGATGPAHINVHTVPIRSAALEKLVQRVATKFSSRNLGFRQAAHQLYRVLFAPLEKDLRGARTLCVIPDGALWRIPLQALLDGQDRFLVEKYTIFYAPSVSVLAATETAPRNDAPTRKTLLAFGNPRLTGATVERAETVYRSGELQPLPEAEREVRSLARVYGTEQSRILVGDDATERTAKSESGNFRIIHFATHGNLNDANPMYSHIVLSAADGDPEDDGLLEAWEIMEIKLHADLVVLSACETARGRVGSGEGLVGLTWALFVAGSRTTVASEWKVESESTSRLMVDFHRALVAHTSHNSSIEKAECLRAAQGKLMKNPSYRHPFYWSPFVLVTVSW